MPATATGCVQAMRGHGVSPLEVAPQGRKRMNCVGNPAIFRDKAAAGKRRGSKAVKGGRAVDLWQLPCLLLGPSEGSGICNPDSDPAPAKLAMNFDHIGIDRRFATGRGHKSCLHPYCCEERVEYWPINHRVERGWQAALRRREDASAQEKIVTRRPGPHGKMAGIIVEPDKPVPNAPAVAGDQAAVYSTSKRPS
jgi:hypothetical protein